MKHKEFETVRKVLRLSRVGTCKFPYRMWVAELLLPVEKDLRVQSRTATVTEWHEETPPITNAEVTAALVLTAPSLSMWKRRDHALQIFVTTKKSGSAWKSVIWRRTLDATTGEILGDHSTVAVPSKELHLQLPGCFSSPNKRVRDTATTL